jgi:hypothetical protein
MPSIAQTKADASKRWRRRSEQHDEPAARQMNEDAATDRLLSIVLILRDPADSADGVLDALRREPGAEEVEIVLVDGRPEDGGGEYERVTHISAPGLNMPQLKALGAARARGGYIAFLEPKGVPADGWGSAIRRALDDNGTAALTGPVLYGGTGGAFDRAAYLFEYGAFAARSDSETAADLAGNNMALPAGPLQSLCGHTLRTHGLNKPFIQQELLAGGVSLRWVAGMAIRLQTKHQPGPFLKSRFQYGRCFGGVRCAEASPVRAALYRTGTPLIPPLVLYRAVRRSVGTPLLDAGSFFWLMAICAVWAAGEIAGCWAGAGDSSNRLY